MARCLFKTPFGKSTNCTVSRIIKIIINNLSGNSQLYYPAKQTVLNCLELLAELLFFQLISMFIVAKSYGSISLSYYFEVINKIIP